MSLKIAVTGSSGLIGSHLTKKLTEQGYTISRVVRRLSSLKNQESGVLWNISEGRIEHERLEGHDVFIHLAGCNIADHRWSTSYKKLIYESRIQSTKLLSQTLVKLKQPPRVLISASAVGYYGPNDPEVKIDETHPPGKGFLREVCVDWEQATRPAQAKGIRVIHLRLGVVLSSQGGALAKMLPIFKLGLGGRLGAGQQMMSWIAMEEIPSIVNHLIQDRTITGAVNCVSPQPVTNEQFSKVLADVLHRPAIFPVPAGAVKILLGEMGEELLLGGCSVYPKRLQDSRYVFRFPDLKSALVHILR